MKFLERRFPEVAREGRGELLRLAAMMGLFFLAVCAVGILRPIKNSLALDGLAATQFYKVYLVSAAVVVFVPLFNALSARIPWSRLIPGVAVFFALNLVVFRFVYAEGSATFGLVFYGWYDLFAAALVTQFFIATQLYFNSRNAKRAYPVVIAGGALGATAGGAITGFFAEVVGTPNLLLVAAGVIGIFAAGLPLVWAGGAVEGLMPKGVRLREKVGAADLAAVARNPHVRLIALSVLLTVLVKQLVDYQFNTVTREVFETRDAVSAFQGKFNAATQWLPIVALATLRPLLTRWGVGAAVLMLPVAMVVATTGVALFWGLWAAVVVKAAETSLRYSAERTGREILYVPVPEAIKMKAKVYIDVAVEKGLGKVLSAGLIMALLSVMEYWHVAFVAIGLSVVWVVVALQLRREYVRTLATAVRGRFASFRGVFASIADASTLPVVREALAGKDALQVAFALELLEQAAPDDVARLAPELHALLEHPSEELRGRALDVLRRAPDAVEPGRVQEMLADEAEAVRERAVRLLAALEPEGGTRVLEELLASEAPGVRRAALACLVRGEVEANGGAALGRDHIARLLDRAAADPGARLEIALAAGTLGAQDGAGDAGDILDPLLDDEDLDVRAAAIRSAGRTGSARHRARLVEALRHPRTREAARAALAEHGAEARPLLLERLLDPAEHPAIRRSIPAVLARMPGQETVDGMIDAIVAEETDQLLDFRILKALGKLRANHPELAFDTARVGALLDREIETAGRYLSAREALAGRLDGDRLLALLDRSLDEAWHARREGAFRCLGLLHPPEGVHAAHQAVAGRGRTARANALEWLERTVGHAAFRRLDPVLLENASAGSGPSSLDEALARLRDDEDSWIARCARRAADARGLAEATEPRRDSMDLIEKVFLLQKVDLLQGAQGAHLAIVASIAEVVDADGGVKLVRRGEPPAALYIVLEGAVELEGGGGERMRAEEGAAFGTWALIDDSPSVVEGETVGRTRLLRITRSDFHDLLADNAELAVGLLQGLARRIRAIAMG